MFHNKGVHTFALHQSFYQSLHHSNPFTSISQDSIRKLGKEFDNYQFVLSTYGLKRTYSSQARQFHFSSKGQCLANKNGSSVVLLGSGAVTRLSHLTGHRFDSPLLMRNYSKNQYTVEEYIEPERNMEWDEIDAFEFDQFEQLDAETFNDNLRNYAIHLTKEDLFCLRAAGFFGLKNFYQHHVQYWGPYFFGSNQSDTKSSFIAGSADSRKSSIKHSSENTIVYIDSSQDGSQSANTSNEDSLNEKHLNTIHKKDSSIIHANNFPVQESKMYLEALLLSSFSLSADDTTTLCPKPLVDASYCTTLQNLQDKIDLQQVWKESRRMDALSREERNINISQKPTSIMNRKIHPKMKFLKWLSVQKFAAIADMPQVASLRPLIILLQASGITEEYIHESALNWIQYSNLSNVHDNQTFQEYNQHLKHLIALYLQWGKRSGQQNRLERLIVKVCSSFFETFCDTYMPEDTMLLEFYVDLVVHRKDMDVVPILQKIAKQNLPTSTKVYIYKKIHSLGVLERINTNELSQEVLKSLLPVLIDSNASNTYGRGEWAIHLFTKYMNECKRNREVPQSEIVCSYLCLASKCTLENIHAHYSHLNATDRAKVLNRMLTLLLLRGQSEEAVIIFNEHCQNVSSPFYVKPNMDMVFSILKIHVLVNQNLPQAMQFLGNLPQVNMMGNNIEELIDFLETLFKKRKLSSKDDLYNLPNALQIYKSNLKELQTEEQWKLVEEELISEIEADDLMYNVGAVYQLMNPRTES